MGERFADLSPISFSEYEAIGSLALVFFNPLNSDRMREELEMSPREGAVVPFSANDFYMFLRKKLGYENMIYKVHHILSLMERAELLTNEGHAGSVLLGDHYYNLKELTNLQKRNTYWLGEAFGFSYLQEKLNANVIHITGKDKNGRIGNGTGFLINSTTVLTCKHVVTDMAPDDHLSILGNEYTFSVKASDSRDIALLVLDKAVEGITSFPIFNSANVLDEVIIMGYPPITGADSDYILSQRGEVNSIIYDYLSRTKNLVLSSITRPGNSGGPVISKAGYIVGMVTQFNVSGESAGPSGDSGSSSKNDNEIDRFPFYMAMQGESLFKGIKEIDSDVDIFFEDYQ